MRTGFVGPSGHCCFDVAAGWHYLLGWSKAWVFERYIGESRTSCLAGFPELTGSASGRILQKIQVLHREMSPLPRRDLLSDLGLHVVQTDDEREGPLAVRAKLVQEAVTPL
jgi:hypothetical protein